MKYIGGNMAMKNCCCVNAIRIVVGITMLALLLAGSANAATITVNASGGGDYTRIQEAIDNASAGDTILVYSGIYYENVNVNKQLTLRGIGNPVVDARGTLSAITLSVNGIVLEGFTATGSGRDKAGITVTSNNNTLSGNNASNNGVYDYGPGISLSYSSNNTLTGNNASNNEIGISLSYSSSNMLSNNIASNNKYGNGMSLYYSSNNTLSGNNASNNHHGISLSYSSSNMLSNNNASNNEYGGGIYLESSSNNTLDGNNASNNGKSDYFGFGISLSSSSNNNTLSSNNASNNEYGGGIYLSYSSNNMLNGNIMTGNYRNFNLVRGVKG